MSLVPCAIMAVVILGGLFTSTVLSLLVLPPLILRHGGISPHPNPRTSDVRP